MPDPSVAQRLASALGHRDEEPNIALAAALVDAGDKRSIADLVDLTQTGGKAVQNDAVKVLYEIGACDPSLIAAHGEAFVALLSGRNNRLIWGAMTALREISRIDPDFVFRHIDAIGDAADRGSVIAKDQWVNILITLAGHEQWVERALAELLDQLKTCALNQLPMYAERSVLVVPAYLREQFGACLRGRLDEDMKPGKRKRLEKVLKRL